MHGYIKVFRNKKQEIEKFFNLLYVLKYYTCTPDYYGICMHVPYTFDASYGKRILATSAFCRGIHTYDLAGSWNRGLGVGRLCKRNWVAGYYIHVYIHMFNVQFICDITMHLNAVFQIPTDRQTDRRISASDVHQL